MITCTFNVTDLNNLQAQVTAFINSLILQANNPNPAGPVPANK